MKAQNRNQGWKHKPHPQPTRETLWNAWILVLYTSAALDSAHYQTKPHQTARKRLPRLELSGAWSWNVLISTPHSVWDHWRTENIGGVGMLMCAFITNIQPRAKASHLCAHANSSRIQDTHDTLQTMKRKSRQHWKENKIVNITWRRTTPISALSPPHEPAWVKHRSDRPQLSCCAHCCFSDFRSNFKGFISSRSTPPPARGYGAGLSTEEIIVFSALASEVLRNRCSTSGRKH